MTEKRNVIFCQEKFNTQTNCFLGKCQSPSYNQSKTRDINIKKNVNVPFTSSKF